MPLSVRRASVIGGALALLILGWLLTGGRLSGVFESGPPTDSLYEAQARSLLHGHMDLPPEVAGVEGISVDGGTHVYFGVFPALLRLPVVAFTDGLDGQLSVVSMLFGFVVLLWAAARLCWLARSHFEADQAPTGSGAVTAEPDRYEPWLVGGFVFAVGIASPVAALAVGSEVYFESAVWALATTLVAMVLVASLWRTWSWRNLVLAGLMTAAALSSRASIGVVALAALLIVAARGWRRWGGRHGSAAVAVALVPLALYVAVNQARFDSPYRIPWGEQVYSDMDDGRRAALAATDGRLMGPQYVPTAALQYLRPDAVRPSTLFPFVVVHPVKTVGDVALDIVEPTASLPTLAPSLCCLAMVGAWAMCRRDGASVWLALTLASAAGLVGVLTIASVANRYLGDFVPLLVVAASVGLWWARDLLRGKAVWLARLALAAVAALTLVGAASASSVTLVTQRLHFSTSHEAIASFVTMQYELHDRIFGGRPPNVTVADRLPDPSQADLADVVVLSGCRGVYWLTPRGWTYVERGPGRTFHLTGTVGEGRTPLLTSGEWQLALHAEPGGPMVVEVGGRSAPGSLGAVDLPFGEVTLAIVADPVGGVVQVRQGDRLVLDGYGVSVPDVPLAAARGWSGRDLATPLCDRLLAGLK